MQKSILWKISILQCNMIFFAFEPESLSKTLEIAVLFNVYILPLTSLRHPRIISSHHINDDPSTSNLNFVPILGRGWTNGGHQNRKCYTYWRQKCDRHLFRKKSEILMQTDTEKNKELPTSKPHFRPICGEGQSPWGYQEKSWKAILMMSELWFWYILIFLMIRMIYKNMLKGYCLYS